jgi:methionine synthase I (cobalamin-dependent)
MAAGMPALLEADVRIIGGCCGSTPAHIQRFREILDHARHENRARP